MREAISDLVVLDTSVLIDDMRTGRHSHRIASLQGVFRNCSVVLAELRRGASTAIDRQLVYTLEKNHPILTPTKNNWIESGQILAKVRKDKRFEPSKLRDLHFDVLIALTACSHGARLITSNRVDFELIRKYRDFALEVW